MTAKVCYPPPRYPLIPIPRGPFPRPPSPASLSCACLPAHPSWAMPTLNVAPSPWGPQKLDPSLPLISCPVVKSRFVVPPCRRRRELVSVVDSGAGFTVTRLSAYQVTNLVPGTKY